MACSKSKLLMDEHLKYSKIYLRDEQLLGEMMNFADNNDLWEDFLLILPLLLVYLQGHSVGGYMTFSVRNPG